MQSSRARPRRSLTTTLATCAVLVLLAMIAACRCGTSIQRIADREAELDGWASSDAPRPPAAAAA